MSTATKASRDAKEYARAKMFYGDGAGTRRKLIEATVESRAHSDPTYARAFRQALANQDMAEHAKKAQNERKRIDRAAAISRNVKGALTGNSKSLNTAVLVLGVAAYAAHQTGYDKKLIAKGRTFMADVRARRARKRNVHVLYDDQHIRH